MKIVWLNSNKNNTDNGHWTINLILKREKWKFLNMHKIVDENCWCSKKQWWGTTCTTLSN